jgi:Ca-activated chloride channel family protein
MLGTLFQQISFEWPWMLGLLAFIPLLYMQVIRGGKNLSPRLMVSEMPAIAHGYNLKTSLRNLPAMLRLLALASLVVALARPVRKEMIELHSGKGVEIMLCMDVSGSMLAKDFTPNRLEAAQEVARAFIARRKGDKIGLVIFAGQSLTLCPLTTDHDALLYQLNHNYYGILTDGTSIGSGLASAVDRLRLGEAASKVIVLLTDGEDTGGKIDPVTAKDIAKTFGVKVYTIGMGNEGYAEIPYQSTMGTTVLEKEKVSIDEDLLRNIADETGGAYFRAKNMGELENIYAAIDKLETSDIRTTVFNKKHEAFLPFLLTALVLLLLEGLLANTWLRRFP